MDRVLTDIEADPEELTSVQGNPELEAKLSKELRKRVQASRKSGVPLESLRKGL